MNDAILIRHIKHLGRRIRKNRVSAKRWSVRGNSPLLVEYFNAKAEGLTYSVCLFAHEYRRAINRRLGRES